MERQLLEAAMVGSATSMKEMAAQDPSLLLGTTPQGNTCLHISSIHGHEGFCKDVLTLNNSLLTVANMDGETPLLTAVTNGHLSLASILLECCCTLGFSEAILQQDRNGCNALHHAIHCGHKDLALELILKEPALSKAVNKYSESPMFIAVMRDFTDVSEKLLEIPGSSHVGTYGHNALHATVRNGNAGENYMDYGLNWAYYLFIISEKLATLFLQLNLVQEIRFFTMCPILFVIPLVC